MPKQKHNSDLILPSIKELVSIGAHFGHERSKAAPKIKPYIFTIKDRVLVIDLKKTQEKLQEALTAASKMASLGRTFLFVGTKVQATESISKAAQLAGMPYVNFRWLGGTLTNFETILKNIKKLEKLEELVNSPTFDEYTKKERGLISKKIDKLNRLIGGIKTLKRLPDALIVVDLVEERVAAREAQMMNIPIFGLIDTNADPTIAQYPIPVNDDSRKAVELILNLFTQAIITGKNNPQEMKSTTDNMTQIESQDQPKKRTKKTQAKKAKTSE